MSAANSVRGSVCVNGWPTSGWPHASARIAPGRCQTVSRQPDTEVTARGESRTLLLPLEQLLESLKQIARALRLQRQRWLRWLPGAKCRRQRHNPVNDCTVYKVRSAVCHGAHLDLLVYLGGHVLRISLGNVAAIGRQLADCFIGRVPTAAENVEQPVPAHSRLDPLDENEVLPLSTSNAPNRAHTGLRALGRKRPCRP